MSLYKIEKLFGDIALDKGYISNHELVEALTIQLEEDLSRKPHRLIGQILKELGHMNTAQMRQVLQHMQFPTAFCLRHVEVAHGLDYRSGAA